MRNKITKLFPIVAILFLASWLVVYTPGDYDDKSEQEAVQVELTRPLVTSSSASVQEISRSRNSPASNNDNVRYNSSAEFPFLIYITPEDQAIETLAASINGVRDAYKVAVQWIYVSEQTLNQNADKWLTPHEFLTNTPHYPSNPLKGKEVSDCEEQAHTLVSLIRAEGIRPEEIRVAIGRIKFGDAETGHAWVELLTNGHWLVLDPSSGPYWDDKAGKLVNRQGLPFDYYANHTFPVLQVWAYYNDIYYLDPGDGSGNAPDSWREDAPVK